MRHAFQWGGTFVLRGGRRRTLLWGEFKLVSMRNVLLNTRGFLAGYTHTHTVGIHPLPSARGCPPIMGVHVGRGWERALLIHCGAPRTSQRHPTNRGRQTSSPHTKKRRQKPKAKSALRITSCALNEKPAQRHLGHDGAEGTNHSKPPRTNKGPTGSAITARDCTKRG